MDTNKREKSDLGGKNLKNAERNNVADVKRGDLRRDNDKPVTSDRDPKHQDPNHQDPKNQEPRKHPTNEDPTKHDKAKPATGDSR
jgi:hypothetical protein